MQTFFNSDELELIQNKQWFETKASAAAKTIVFLGKIEKIIHENRNFVFNNPENSSKITKGENLKGFPYFVMDMPKLTEEQNIFSIRIIVWWGNYISTNLLMGENILEAYKIKIMQNFNPLRSNSVYVNIANDLWQHDLSDAEHFIRGQNLTVNQLITLKKFKVAVKTELTSMNALEEILQSVELLNSILV